jgi:flagellar basal-body rod modification protein FlgD
MNFLNVVSGANAVIKGLSGNAKADTTSTTSTSTSENGDFIKLLLAQITNQNPLEPMDNAEMVTQLSQSQMVAKLEDLDDKMGSLLSYQNMMNSINLMGKTVSLLNTETGGSITGTVDGIKMYNGTPTVVVNGVSYDMALIQKVE